jgi:hypothetical protein
MERRRWLRKHRANSKRGPGRWVYETTPAGRQVLREWLRGGPNMGDERFAFLAQIYLMDELGDLGETRRFFERMREQFATRLLALQQVEKRWAECDPHFLDSLPADWFHIHLTLRKGLISLAAHIRWCDECLRRISVRMQERTHKEKKNGRSISTVRRNQVDPHRRGKRGAAALLGSSHVAKGQ